MAASNATPAAAATEEIKQENVPTIKAYKDPRFLTSPLARHVRIMCELQEPEKRLTENSVDNYILFLGSHLVMHPEERAKQVADLEKQLKAGGPRDEIEALNAKVRFAKNLQPMDKYYTVAMELAAKVAQWSKDRQAQGLPAYHIGTGGGPGIMEAANRGAQSTGHMTLGFGSTRPEWGSLNKYVSSEGAFEFHYFFMRKFWMAYKCMGLVVLPGGFGALDELFEFLQLVASKRITHRMPIVLLGKDHWKKAINFEYLVECSMISAENAELFVYMDTAEEAFEYLVKQVTLANQSGDNAVVEDAKRRRLAKTASNSGGH
eukprot:CAMPEP_0197887558 /NCGR_PEP_ID=MMETSP1439-20131203/19488_1 /TAXON_ID=66791 /ORGANISM="Gonyaulax spinifera, Strain CCMP409" /LENGTH=318 /DNA_ID=CAMNT_0043507407 /DNA_START=76 /DNA_END=1032 /DNA_ORIENTATION=-